MPPLSNLEQIVVHALEETRSVRRTAQQLQLPEPEVKKVAMMAYGMGHLDVDLSDY